MPFITHPTGTKSYYTIDDFTDPWIAREHKQVVFIQHGYCRTSEHWYGWAHALSRKYIVIRRDILGHGHTSDPPAGHPLTVSSVLDELVDTLDQLQLDQVHWVGDSTGGIWGELLAAAHPERVRSLTVIASPLALGEAGRDVIRFEFPTPEECMRRVAVDGWCRRFIDFSGTHKDAPQEFQDWWVRTAAVSSTEGVAKYCTIMLEPEFDAAPIMHKITAPTLIIAPTDSPLINHEDQKRLHEAVKGSRLEWVEGGHEPYLSAAERCQKLWLEFAAEHNA